MTPAEWGKTVTMGVLALVVTVAAFRGMRGLRPRRHIGMRPGQPEWPVQDPMHWVCTSCSYTCNVGEPLARRVHEKNVRHHMELRLRSEQ